MSAIPIVTAFYAVKHEDAPLPPVGEPKDPWNPGPVVIILLGLAGLCYLVKLFWGMNS
jgi:hypothetical protein